MNLPISIYISIYLYPNHSIYMPVFVFFMSIYNTQTKGRGVKITNIFLLVKKRIQDNTDISLAVITKMFI